jgi:hypothetical protein
LLLLMLLLVEHQQHQLTFTSAELRYLNMGLSVFPAASGGLIRKSTSFASSGTFTLPAGYGAGNPLIVDIEICGGGAGGGSGAISNSNPTGGGGGGGSGVTTLYRNIALTANATITIGAGGNGGTARGGTALGFAGASGGASNVDSTFYAPGGGGGSGGQLSNSANNIKGLGVNSFGFYIPGGYSASITEGPGGGGGSGGGSAVNANSGQFPIVYGGSRGSAGLSASIISDGAATTDIEWNSSTNLQGKGLAATPAGGTSAPTASALPAGGSNEILILQRGGGGGGGKGNVDNEQSGGGTAGTRFNGGRSGYNNSTSVTGSRNGTAATDAGCGGGGGSGIFAGSGSSGAGGNGAAGYCIIYYWG